MRGLFFFLIQSMIFLLSITSYAEDCFSFKDTGVGCIEKKLEDLSDSTLDIKKLTTGMILYYQTDLGALGKIRILANEVDAKTCSLYLDFETFNKKGKNYNNSSSYTIKNYLGIWDKKSIDFDHNHSGHDFLLSRFKDKETSESSSCYLQSVGGKLVMAGEEEKVISGGSILIYLSALFLMGLATFLIAKTVFEEESEYQANEKLEELENEESVSHSDGIILKISRPFYRRYFVPIVLGMKGKKNVRDEYKRKIASAGMTKKLTGEELYAYKLFLIIGFPTFFLLIRYFLETDWPLALTPLVAAVGYIYPDIWIKSKSDQRKNEVLANMPFVVDMLALSVEAGLDFMAAIGRVVEKAPPSALVDELKTLQKEVQLGAGRAQALRQLSWRIDTLPMSSFVATLIAADSVGASISGILKSLSEEIRSQRSTLIEKKGAEASTKILFPMMIFILPAVVLVIATPIIMDFLG